MVRSNLYWMICLTLGLAGLFYAPPKAHATPPLASKACAPGDLERAQAAYQSLASFQAGFAQEDHLATGQVRKAQGHLEYERPGKMRWAYAPPDEQVVLTDGKKAWLYDPLLDNVTVTGLKAVTQGTPLGFLLGTGDLARDFTCRQPTAPMVQTPSAQNPGPALTWLELVPAQPIPGVAWVRLGVVAENFQLVSIAISDGGGNLRTVRLSGLKAGMAFPKGHFVFKVKPGMEVIER